MNMDRKLLTALIFFSFSFVLFAQDTVVVQTFTYDMITKRRGVFKFPDDTKQFRKILMLHSLKCDPKTPHDKYNCGEWDYLINTNVYVPTGRYDSTEKEHPFFKLGWDAPDSVEYTMDTTKTIYQHKYVRTVEENVSNEEAFEIGQADGEIVFDGKIRRMQFVLDSKDLKNMGFTKGNIDKIALKVKQPGTAILRLAIRMKSATAGKMTNFDNVSLDTMFYSDVTFDQTGWKEIMFTHPYKWTGFSSVLFEISYVASSGTAPVFEAWSASKAIQSVTSDRFLYFDGQNDAVEIHNKMADIYGANKLTLEAWVNVKSWQAWNRIIGTDKFNIELGNETGQIYCIVRNPDNTHGNVNSVITLNRWHHIAMVYDGRQEANSDKLKLYIDGKQKILSFSGEIPSTTDTTYYQFSFSGVGGDNQTLNGSIDEVRVWKDTLPGDVIANWFSKKLNNTHPDYSKIIAYYSFDNNSGTVADDEASGSYPGTLIGCPEWIDESAMSLKFEIEPMAKIPVMKFYRGDYTTHTEENIVEDTVKDPPISIVKYRVNNNQAEAYETLYAWKAGYSFKYDSDGNKVDSTFYSPQYVLQNHTLTYFEKPYEVIDQYEIGRFITPYGIGLDLGPDGFTWTYDVTDYAPLLQGEVDLSSGNLQELIDLKFLFIKGTPPRDVVNIHRVWGPMRSYNYKDLASDAVLREKEVQLNPNTKQIKLVTRLTGHGHNSNNGSYPHCCEWKNNTHYLIVNGQQEESWHIWQTNDCAMNPVYPQGGTWPGSREGWCPGDLVKDHDFELTKFITNNSIKLDYNITPVPTNNLGMGNGVYYTAMQLIEYGESNFDKDVEVYNVVMPSNNPYYSRINPICANPIVVFRNNGKNKVEALTLKYNVSSGEEEVYHWTGSLEPNEMMTVSLPISGSEFWLGDNKNVFFVTVLDENGNDDDYPENSTFLSHFNMPDLLPGKVVLEYKTNNRPQDYTLQIKDLTGNVMLSKINLNANTVYKDTLDFQEGCYTLEFTDSYNMGLSYWAYPDQGSGYIRFTDLIGKPLKNFNPDCGHGYNYAFNLGNVTLVQENNENYYLQSFPNPTQNNVNLIVSYPIGDAVITIYDITGNILWQTKENIASDFSLVIPTNSLPAGTYFIQVINAEYQLSSKFIKK